MAYNILFMYKSDLAFPCTPRYMVFHKYTVNNYRQVTGIATGENFAFFIYRHFVEIL